MRTRVWFLRNGYCIMGCTLAEVDAASRRIKLIRWHWMLARLRHGNPYKTAVAMRKIEVELMKGVAEVQKAD